MKRKTPLYTISILFRPSFQCAIFPHDRFGIQNTFWYTSDNVFFSAAKNNHALEHQKWMPSTDDASICI